MDQLSADTDDCIDSYLISLCSALRFNFLRLSGITCMSFAALGLSAVALCSSFRARRRASFDLFSLCMSASPGSIGQIQQPEN